MDRVLYFGTPDSPDATESVFRFLRMAGPSRGCVGGVGWDDCRVKAPGGVLGFGSDFGGGGGGVTMFTDRMAAVEDISGEPLKPV